MRVFAIYCSYFVYMKFRQYLTFKILGTILAWAAWLLVLFRVDPVTTNNLGIVLFYITFSLAVVGTVSTSLMLIRVYLYKRLYTQRLVVICFRQGMWIAAAFSLLLFFSSQHVIAWWNATILLLLMGLIELFYLRLKQQPKIVWEKEVS